MPHWRTQMDNDNRFVAAFDLGGKDITLVIDDVKTEKVDSQKGESKRKVAVYFKGAKKPLLANVTNCKTIASLYGTDTDKWKGKAIALYPTTTSAFGEVVECIRVRPIAAAPSAAASAE